MRFATNAMRLPAVAAAVAALGLSAAVAAPQASAATARPAVAPHVTCPWHPANNDNVSGHFLGTGINIRIGPSSAPGCTSIGQGQPGHTMHERCWTHNNSDGFDWVYLTDNTTGKTGWSRQDLVTFIGSLVAC
jgi:hypothetical protein